MVSCVTQTGAGRVLTCGKSVTPSLTSFLREGLQVGVQRAQALEEEEAGVSLPASPLTGCGTVGAGICLLCASVSASVTCKPWRPLSQAAVATPDEAGSRLCVAGAWGPPQLLQDSKDVA